MTALETANASEATALALAKATENIAATDTAAINTNLRLLNLEKALKYQEQRTNEVANNNRKAKAQKNLSRSQTSEPLASPEQQALKQQKRRIVDLMQSDSNDAEIWKPQGTPKTKKPKTGQENPASARQLQQVHKMENGSGTPVQSHLTYQTTALPTTREPYNSTPAYGYIHPSTYTRHWFPHSWLLLPPSALYANAIRSTGTGCMYQWGSPNQPVLPTTTRPRVHVQFTTTTSSRYSAATGTSTKPIPTSPKTPAKALALWHTSPTTAIVTKRPLLKS
jgi:hypothetical protein